jgi:outer membrane PBP1 activator LpoA protein
VQTQPPAEVSQLPALPTGPIRRVALLLPLSGSEAPVGEALRDGFLAAHFASPTPRPELVILDERQPDAAAAYRTGTDAGADVVVGPLLKESVARVAQIAGVIPTLALNYVEDAGLSPPFFLQFSLSPEDEARQVAEAAVAEGRFRAVALAPDSDWGRRILEAFEPRLIELGGSVLAYRLYDPAATDYTADIQRLLLLDESRARQRELAAFLGQTLEFEPRLRGDVDFIFLAANPGNGRLIRPQLRFLYAADVPTYSTSAIFMAGTGSENDLDGVKFADAPAVIGSGGDAQDLRSVLAQRWPPRAQQRMRLYAMGYDAWALMTALREGRAVELDGLSGRLFADRQGRIHRRLSWAQIQNGRVVPIAVPPPESLPAAFSTPR